MPYLLQGNEHRSTPSIGVALFNDRSQGVDGLLKQADLAMYQAKAMGRNTMRFFDGSMQTAVDQRMSMENDLREALQRGDFLRAGSIPSAARFRRRPSFRWPRAPA